MAIRTPSKRNDRCVRVERRPKFREEARQGGPLEKSTFRATWKARYPSFLVGGRTTHLGSLVSPATFSQLGEQLPSPPLSPQLDLCGISTRLA